MLSNRVVVTLPITNGAITVKMVLTEANSRTKNNRSLCPFKYLSSRLKVWVFMSDSILSQLDFCNLDEYKRQVLTVDATGGELALA